MDFDVFLEQDEDGVWVVEVPSLPGVYTQGESKKQAMDHIKEAIRLHLETEGPPGSRCMGVDRVRVEW